MAEMKSLPKASKAALKYQRLNEIIGFNMIMAIVDQLLLFCNIRSLFVI